MKKRKVDIVVISDVHLGTYGCQADELVKYLKSIEPGILILNGDIIDIWQFSKRYWPRDHMLVIKQFVKFIAKEIPVYYLTGNHDELLRKFSDFHLANFHLRDKLVLEVEGKKAWFFHGDVFDTSITHAKWLAKLGGLGYDLLILINTLVNAVLRKMGRPRMSFSKKIKQGVKRAVKFIGDFEQVASDLAIDNQYDYVVCGHIHQPSIREVSNKKGSVTYLNSGDWVENLTSLEYKNGAWSIYQHEPVPDNKSSEDEAGSITQLESSLSANLP